MPIFGESTSPYDEFVEKVTAETLTNENWELMINICDRVNIDPKGPKNCLLSVKKRLNHRDPHVVLLALSLLDCLWSNCGQKFRREVSSKEFISELNYKCTNVKEIQRGNKTKTKTKSKSNRVVAEKARSLIKKWVEDECKKDNSLSLVESLYKELLDQGYTFETDPTSTKKKTMISTDPNVVVNDQEEADIAKAIALSLQESGTNKKQSTNANNNAYPSLRNNEPSQNNSFSSNSMIPQQMVKQVRALYDFEAVEDNEISFVAGDIITITDDSDQNWWRGTTSRGMAGLFPASFVTTDLKDPQNDAQMAAQNDEKATEIDAENGRPNGAKVKIDENVLLKCIELIEGLDPALDASSDPPELALLENLAMAQAPLIDQKLMQIDKQLSQLAEVDLAIRDVLGAYDSAVQQVAGGAPSSSANVANAHQNSPQPVHPPPPILQMAPIQGGGQGHSAQHSEIGNGNGGGQWQ